MPRPRSPCSLSARFRQKEGGLLKRWARDLIGAAERHRMSCCKLAEMQTSLGSEMRACVVLAGLSGRGLGTLPCRMGWASCMQGVVGGAGEVPQECPPARRARSPALHSLRARMYKQR